MKEHTKYTETVVISVESQKGGVGKTTAALNVARLLLKSGRYRVLFFDLDIAGTEAAVVHKSPLWEDDTHVVSFRIGNKGEQTNNLVELFTDYMSGNDIPHFEWKKISKGHPSLAAFDQSKINILSSCLLRAHGTERIHQYGPQVLFDEAHAAWFLQMIKSIVTNAGSGKDSPPLAVIVDTSPGFSGLGPNIEEWLTDLGPQRGKFLFVSSADLQDITACIYAIKRVEGAFATKLEAAQTLWRITKNHSAEQTGHFQAAEGGKHSFFMRLLRCLGEPEVSNTTGWRMSGALSSDVPSWYLSPDLDYQSHLGQLSQSWAMIHNRIPSMLLDKAGSVDLQLVVPDLGEKSLTEIVKKCRDNIGARAVPYDLEYALQFVFPELLERCKDSVAMSLPEGTEVPPQPAPRFTKGSDLLHFLLDADGAFHKAAHLLRIEKHQKLNTSWFELSPVWLYTQFVRPAPWESELERLVFISKDRLRTSAAVIYKNAFEYYVNFLRQNQKISWVEECFIVAFVLRSVLHRSSRNSVMPIWLRGRLVYLNKLLSHELVLDNWPSSWSSRPIPQYARVVIPDHVLPKRKTRYVARRLKKIEALLAELGTSYNRALEAYQSVRFMHSLARYARIRSDSGLFAIAESLLRQVLTQRAISFERAEELIESMIFGGSERHHNLARISKDMSTIESFTRVLTPILKNEGWRLI